MGRSARRVVVVALVVLVLQGCVTYATREALGVPGTYVFPRTVTASPPGAPPDIGRAAFWALLPLTLTLDAVTLPAQALFMLWALSQARYGG